jgi:hypothetical protein
MYNTFQPLTVIRGHLGTLQILRSIDSDSADGFPSHQQEAMQMGLDSGKGKIIEYSIQKVCAGTPCIQALHCTIATDGTASRLSSG